VNLDKFASGLETLTRTVEVYDPYMTHADVAPPAGMADFLRRFVEDWHDPQTQVNAIEYFVSVSLLIIKLLSLTFMQTSRRRARGSQRSILHWRSYGH
jgi:hypothetical protein